MKKPFPTVPPLFASTLYWIFLFSFLQQLLLVNPPSLSSPLTQTATNSGLFLAHVRCVCVCIHMMDEGDVSHLSHEGEKVVDGMSGEEVEGEAKSELVRGHMQRQLLLHKKWRIEGDTANT